MGCAGSKDEVFYEKSDHAMYNLNHKEEIKEEIKEDKDDIDLQIVNPARRIPINQLDEILNENLLNKTIDKGLNDPFESKKVDKSITINENIDRHEKVENLDDSNNLVAKSKTFAPLSDENHPHEFDFSFLQDKPKESNPIDILTDQILKEISDLD